MQNDFVDSVQGPSDTLLTTRMATAYALGLIHVSRLKNRCSHHASGQSGEILYENLTLTLTEICPRLFHGYLLPFSAAGRTIIQSFLYLDFFVSALCFSISHSVLALSDVIEDP